jgi:hypothetical protein
MPPSGGIFKCGLLFFSLAVLALLIRNAAACLASGLAGGLALTAATVYGTVTKIACFDSFDMQHNWILQSYSIFVHIISAYSDFVNTVRIFSVRNGGSYVTV